jgi:hypothetical protein
VKANFASMIRWLRRGVPLPLGAIHNKRSFVALDNLVSFIALCADRTRSPKAANQVFLISDGEALQEMTLNWAIDVIKEFKIDSKQVIFMSYDLRSDETYKLLLNEFLKFREYPINVIAMDTYLFEPHSGFGNLPLPTKEIKPYRYVCYNANAKFTKLS